MVEVSKKRSFIMEGDKKCFRGLMFEKVERIPLKPGAPRESTIARWHKEGLPKDVNKANYMEFLFKQLGIEDKIIKPKAVLPARKPMGISFDPMPAFEEKVLEHKDGHYLVQDEKGAIVEIADDFDVTYLRSARDFVTRKWHKFPVENVKDWEEMKKRYNADDPARIFSRREGEGEAVFGGTIWGPFWQLRDWCGFENLCILMATEQDFVEEMVNFWKDFVLALLRRIKESASISSVVISEDMAYKEKSMISPAMVKKYLLPVWSEWSESLKEGGCKVIDLDSDGYIGELIPFWIEAGINCTSPVEVAAGNDIVEYRRLYGKKMAYKGGIDKRAIAKGGKVMEAEVYRVVPPLIKEGGYIPGCDHGVPPDVSWPNFLDYSRLLAKLLGWL